MRLPLGVLLLLFTCIWEPILSLVPTSLQLKNRRTVSVSMSKADMDREAEIRRKIMQLKKVGKIKKEIVDEVQAELDEDDLAELSPLQMIQLQRQRIKKSSVVEDYESAIKEKLGNKKAIYLGLDIDKEPGDSIAPIPDTQLEPLRRGQLGSLKPTSTEATKSVTPQINILDPTLLLKDDEDDNEPEINEEELVELVARKLNEKRSIERKQQEEERGEKIAKIAREAREAREVATTAEQRVSTAMTTSGIGGSWTKNETAEEESYRPSRGSWGYFERPKDISKAFGGGRRVGVGYTKESDVRLSELETKRRLQEYREKVGIDVQSEKDHADEIEDALKIAGVAMQRGIYNVAVSSLEKVTQWCSSNSRVGGNVFLELAMSYEANGQTEEAISIYQTLTKCRIEEIKLNAKKLLYGIEALQFMRDEAKCDSFSRAKSRNAFIDTTGNALANFADNFDDVYRTGYVDIDSGYYRKLSENVVRSNREARQILLRATESGEVNRLKIVQALRSLSRHFDDVLEKEIENAAHLKEPVAMIDGKPILVKKKTQEALIVGVDDFVLASPSQMIDNLNGEWRLQLLADKKGDGVKFFNSAVVWQKMDTGGMSFSSAGLTGFITVEESGRLEFQEDQRILQRCKVETSSGLLSGLFPNIGATSSDVPQQIVTVDSVLLITRCVSGKRRASNEIKEHFAVWRKVNPGTFSK